MSQTKKWPKRSRGRRKEDQIANRVVNWLKLAAMVMGAVFMVYQTGVSLYLQAALLWRSAGPMIR